MKKRSILSISLAIILCFSSLFVSAVSALTMGDVDGDGEVKAADARLALRASVGLENLSEDQKKAADVDYDGQIKAADARIILRASVGLEEIESREHPENHVFNAISTTNTTKCTFDGCEAELPSFNDIVNVLKSTENGANYFTGFVEDTTHNDKIHFSGAMAGLIDDETNVASTETSYSTLLVNRLLTPGNFPTNGEAFVSALSDSEIKSISIQEASVEDLTKTLPDSYSMQKTTYDLTKIKNAQFPEVYKITLVLNPEKIDLKKTAPEKSVYDKVYISDYNKNLETMRKEISGELSSITSEMEEIGISMSSSGTITSSLTVEYYVTVDNFTPVAAKYSNRFDIDFSASVPLMLTMKNTMYMSSNSYYFFNNDFGIEG